MSELRENVLLIKTTNKFHDLSDMLSLNKEKPLVSNFITDLEDLLGLLEQCQKVGIYLKEYEKLKLM